MDTKVESDSNHIGHEHRSFRWSLLSNSYVRGNRTMNTFTCYKNESTDPRYNLALEEYLLCHKRTPEQCLLWWQNEPTVVIGRHQIASEEVHAECIEKYGIHVVRRMSGGGAVYHDLGNLNFSFLVDDQKNGFDFARFTKPLIQTLKRLGVPAENSGRNDVTINGLKISGNAQYKRKGRLLHHGTVLFNTDLERLSEVLNVSPQKKQSNAVASIRSRVTNVLDHLPRKINVKEFQQELFTDLKNEFDVIEKTLRADELSAILKIRDEKYANRDWNNGVLLPPSSLESSECCRAVRRFDWGTIDLRWKLQQGTIKSIVFYGDFFSQEDPARLAEKLQNACFDPTALDRLLGENDIREVFPEWNKRQFLEMLFS
ncbi:MAG: lipoate--protein ligase, partial [Planctomycetaceae bacterium]|nr:lipoate--protein ligase [Planctomycetaceae bacterium]